MKKILLIISVTLMVVNVSSCGVKGELTRQHQEESAKN